MRHDQSRRAAYQRIACEPTDVDDRGAIGAKLLKAWTKPCFGASRIRFDRACWSRWLFALAERLQASDGLDRKECFVAVMPKRLLVGKAYDSDPMEATLMQRSGAEMIAPNKTNRRLPTQPDPTDKGEGERNRVRSGHLGIAGAFLASLNVACVMLLVARRVFDADLPVIPAVASGQIVRNIAGFARF